MDVTNPTSPAGDRFYERFVALTSPENFEELDQALADSLREIHPGCDVLIYRGAYEEGRNTNELSARSAGDNEDTGQSAKYRYSLIQPVFGKHGRQPIITVVIHGQEPVQLHEIFPAVARVYANQVIHITNSTQDNLTGLLTRQSLQSHIHRIQKELSGKKRRLTDIDSNYALAFFDIDYFKHINDNYGHLIGDEVLLLISQLMRKTFRNHDLLFRYGGEEFIVILKIRDKQQSKLALERFRKIIDSFEFPQASHLTISIGHVMLQKELPYDALLGCADKALYYAKENGRNCCYSYEDLVDNNLIPTQESFEGDIELFET